MFGEKSIVDIQIVAVKIEFVLGDFSRGSRRFLFWRRVPIAVQRTAAPVIRRAQRFVAPVIVGTNPEFVEIVHKLLEGTKGYVCVTEPHDYTTFLP